MTLLRAIPVDRKTPVQAGLDQEWLAWRALALHRLYRSAFWIGSVPLGYVAAHVPLRLRIGLVAFIVACALGSFLPRDTRHTRALAWTTVLLIEAVGLLALSAGGVGPGTAIALLASALLAGVFIDPRLVWHIGFANLVALLAPGIAMSAGWIVLPDATSLFDWHSLSVWTRVACSTFVCTVILGSAFTSLIQRLEDGLRERSEALACLEREAAERLVAENSQRLAEAALARSQRLEVVGRLSAGIAHDVNNSLSVVLSWCEVLRAEAFDPDTFDEAIEAIVAAATSAAQLSRQLLATARRDVGKPVPTDPVKKIRQVARTCERALSKSVRIRADLTPVPPVMVDECQLEQVILNLVFNAHDAVPDGGEIVLRCEPANGEDQRGLPEGSYVVLRVQDSGIGMDEVTRERIFEPFFTTKGDRGSGLGLASSRAIVEQSGGRIRVESALAQGSTFSVVLPVAPEPTFATGPRWKQATPVPSKGIRVLLVEPDAALAEALAATLQSSGYDVMLASSVADAVGVARRLRSAFDVLCLHRDASASRNGQFAIDELVGLFPDARVVVCPEAQEGSKVVRYRTAAQRYSSLEPPLTGSALLAMLAEEPVRACGES